MWFDIIKSLSVEEADATRAYWPDGDIIKGAIKDVSIFKKSLRSYIDSLKSGEDVELSHIQELVKPIYKSKLVNAKTEKGKNKYSASQAARWITAYDSRKLGGQIAKYLTSNRLGEIRYDDIIVAIKKGVTTITKL